MVEKGVPQPYKYLDTPDGEDTFKKLWAVLKPTFVVATGAALSDILLISHPKGFVPRLGRFVVIAGPIVGIAATFVLVTNTLAGIRQKQDKINWFLGGVAAGSCVGLWARKPIVGFNAAMAFGAMGVARKDIAEHGWRLIPADDFKTRPGGATTCLRDYSWIAERPRNWTTGTE